MLESKADEVASPPKISVFGNRDFALQQGLQVGRHYLERIDIGRRHKARKVVAILHIVRCGDHQASSIEQGAEQHRIT